MGNADSDRPMKRDADLAELYLALAAAALAQELHERARQWSQQAERVAATESQLYRAKRIRVIAGLALAAPTAWLDEPLDMLVSELLRDAGERGDRETLEQLQAGLLTLRDSLRCNQPSREE
jgi:hypothetical protein